MPIYKSYYSAVTCFSENLFFSLVDFSFIHCRLPFCERHSGFRTCLTVHPTIRLSLVIRNCIHSAFRNFTNPRTSSHTTDSIQRGLRFAELSVLLSKPRVPFFEPPTYLFPLTSPISPPTPTTSWSIVPKPVTHSDESSNRRKPFLDPDGHR